MEKFKKKVVVVIPIHSENPSSYELISFTQCFRILGNHPIVIIAPHGLSLKNYKNIIPDFNTHFIDPKWQSSKLNYNKLKLSNFFYSIFHEYDFLLTYELDSFVFVDNIDYWCSLNYDYIGAPWFLGFEYPTSDFFGVGNSGFSLRRISKVKEGIMLVNYRPQYVSTKTLKKKVKIYLKYFKNVFLKYLSTENPTIQDSEYLSEDKLICLFFPLLNFEFKIAPIDNALKFSFETNPAFLFEKNNHQLPTGCHAWWRFDLDFWKPHILKFGYSI